MADRGIDDSAVGWRIDASGTTEPRANGRVQRAATRSQEALVMWDNRVVQHTAIRDYAEDVRARLKRISVARFR
jgi:alpha-ketoglutarate-dependent taurine dioxygenase